MAPQYSMPVAALLEEASRQEKAGDLTAAVGSVERALRIEPRNAHVWHRLASLRMQQGRHAMAVELAAKSNSLAGGDAELVRDNWRLMARSYRAAGDSASAAAAERKAKAYR
jgi:tetratricopeptide (TPR) repeat protein